MACEPGKRRLASAHTRMAVGPSSTLLDVGPGAASVQKRLLRQRVNCCVARAQAGVLLRRLKFALPGWTEAESRRGAWARESAQRAAQARAFSGEGHSEEWAFFFDAPH